MVLPSRNDRVDDSSTVVGGEKAVCSQVAMEQFTLITLRIVKVYLV